MTTLEQKLQTLACLDPDYPAFASDLPPEALCVGDNPLPDGLAEDVIALLRAERPELSDWLDAQPTTAASAKMGVDPLAAAGVLAAILFLLRSHIKIKGKYFTFEHKPMDNDLLGKVLSKLGAWDKSPTTIFASPLSASFYAFFG